MTALAYPDGLARIRPAHVIRCGRTYERPTEREPYITLDEAYTAWLERLRIRSAS